MVYRANGSRTRSTHFIMGVLAGVAAVGGYTIACDATPPASGTSSGAAGTGVTTVAPAAIDVPYLNAESGLGATTVQAALDEVGTTVLAATGGGVVTGGAPRTTTWSMDVVVLDVDNEALNSTSRGTLKLTETAPGQGSYETSEASFFGVGGPFGELPDSHTGKYFIVGNLVMMTGARPGGGKSAYTWSAFLANAGRAITLSNSGSVTVVLKKQ